uniref:Thioredoxin domain-containing protein n=1 Tax=Ixodes ricinus TaxID=34613 RepID=A0A0K8RKE3_IXORI
MEGLRAVSSKEELDEIASKTSDKLVVLYFRADWAPQCKQVDDLMPDLVKDKELDRTSFYKVDAEQVQELSLKYGVASVPSFVILMNAERIEKVEGVNMPELVRKLKLLQSRVDLPPLASNKKQELLKELRAITGQAPCVLIMEGTPDAPTGAHNTEAVNLLKKLGIQYHHFNITSNAALHQQLLEHIAHKPASHYPLLFVDNEFLGGVDEMRKLAESGRLAELCSQQDLTRRLEQLIRKAPVMVFMKGSPEAPRCGFSRTLMDIFKRTQVSFDSFDILTDEEVRQGLKKYSNWPTYPQVYAKGSLVGGLDIIKELDEAGELAAALNP